MAWVKVDDHFDEHPKLAAVGPVGWGVWLAGLAYCNRNLTDGFIPRAVADAIGGRWRVYVPTGDGRDQVWEINRSSGMQGHDMETEWVAALLVANGLWEETDGGYRVHDYADYQPTRQEVLHERQTTAERVKRWRGKSGNGVGNGERNGVTNAVGDAPRNGAGNAGVTPAPVPVPVPGPVPEPMGQREGGTRAGAREAVPIITAIPGYPAAEAEDVALVEGLAAAYPAVNLAAVAVEWRAWLSDPKHARPKNWRSAYTHWVRVEADRLRKQAEDASANAGPEYPLLTAPPSGRPKVDLSEPDHLTALADAAKPDGGKSPW